MDAERQSRRATPAGILLGVGLGGFVDGIVLHQILQWHNMLSGWVPPVTMEAMRLNMMWDSLFHVLVWLATFAGVILLWHAAVFQRQAARGCAGAGSMTVRTSLSHTPRRAATRQNLELA